MRARSIWLCAIAVASTACEKTTAPTTAPADASSPVVKPSATPTPAAAKIPSDAVVRAGAKVYFDAAGEAGVILPRPEGVPGFAVHVVERAGDRLVVEPVTGDEHHCAGALEGLEDLRLRLYAEESALLPVLADHYTHAFGDGTRVSLSRGVAIVGDDALFARGTAIVAPLKGARLGRTYAPAEPLPLEGGERALPWMPDHPLTYGGHTLVEDALHRNLGGVVQYAVTEKTDHALVTVRGECVEVTAKESLERMRATTRLLIGEIGAGGEIGEIGEIGDGADLATGGRGERELGLIGGRAPVDDGPRVPRGTLGVKEGSTIWWPDGRPAGTVLRAIRPTGTPRDDAQRRCFDVPLAEEPTPTLPLCFDAADVVPLATKAKVDIAAVEPDDGLDGAIISRVLRAHINEVRYCYNQSLARNPKLEGRVIAAFTMDPAGKVNAVQIRGNTLGDPDVGNCIGKAIRRWRFPQTSEGGTVTVTFPLAPKSD